MGIHNKPYLNIDYMSIMSKNSLIFSVKYFNFYLSEKGPGPMSIIGPGPMSRIGPGPMSRIGPGPMSRMGPGNISRISLAQCL